MLEDDNKHTPAEFEVFDENSGCESLLEKLTEHEKELEGSNINKGKNKMEETNNVIVANNTEIVESTHSFKRVDFNDPSTILNYGQDVLEEIEKIVSDATKEFEHDDLPSGDFKKRVDALSGFSEKLDDLEEKRIKASSGSNLPAPLAAIVNGVKKIFKKEENEVSLSYSTEFQLYAENVDLLVEDVTTMYESAKVDFELFKVFIDNIKPYVEILEEVYRVGKADRDAFEKEVLEIEALYAQNPENEAYKRDSIIKRQILDLFDEKLYAIQKSKIAISNVVIQWNMRQINAIKQLSSYKSFISLDKSILKLNGTAVVGAKKQKEEVEMLEYLMDGVNDALVEGPAELVEVTKKVNELTKDGTVKIETFKETDKLLHQGVELLKQGAIEKKKFVQASSKQLETISQHFSDFNIEVKDHVLLEAYNDSDDTITSSRQSKSRTRKKGNRR